MKRLVIGVIAGAFALTAAAQAPAPAATDVKKEKQEMVKGATADTAKGYGTKAAEGSTEAAKTKDMAKTLPQDKASRQQAVGSVTKQTAGTGYGEAAAQGSAKAAADTSPRKPKPKPQLQSPAMKEAAKP